MHQERAQQFDRILRVEPSPKIIQGTINCHRIPKMSKCLDLPANKIEVGSHSTKERFVLGFVYELEKGSIVIGLGLANVAWFIIRSNTKYLVGQSISQDTVMDIQDALEDRNTVKAIMDVKATYLGPDRVRLKAEVQFDGRQVAKNYLSIYSNTEIDDQFRYINSLPDHEELVYYKSH